MRSRLRLAFLAFFAILCLMTGTQALAMYDPGTGRFLQRDPTGYPDGMNAYGAYHAMRGGVDPSGQYVVKGPARISRSGETVAALDAEVLGTQYTDLWEIGIQYLEGTFARHFPDGFPELNRRTGQQLFDDGADTAAVVFPFYIDWDVCVDWAAGEGMPTISMTESYALYRVADNDDMDSTLIRYNKTSLESDRTLYRTAAVINPAQRGNEVFQTRVIYQDGPAFSYSKSQRDGLSQAIYQTVTLSGDNGPLAKVSFFFYQGITPGANNHTAASRFQVIVNEVYQE